MGGRQSAGQIAYRSGAGRQHRQLTPRRCPAGCEITACRDIVSGPKRPLWQVTHGAQPPPRVVTKALSPEVRAVRVTQSPARASKSSAAKVAITAGTP